MFKSGREYVFLTAIGMFLAISGAFSPAAWANPGETVENPTPVAKSTGKTKIILGVSWMPGFCEKQSKTPECSGQDASSVAARQFSLSGLWRTRKIYCGVESGLREQDKKKEWLAMPELSLAEDVKLELAKAMPGVASGYDRHQWVKYGTCSGMVADEYYGRALKMLAVLNGSEVQKLFENNLGGTIREEEVKAAFDAAFGAGAGNRVKMRCSKDGNRRVITGLTIGLGEVEGAEDDLATLIAAAKETKFGCAEGVVDEAGLQ
jgi:ribonuclease T2